MSFHTVFDAAKDCTSAWWFPATGSIFVCVGALLVSRPVLMLKIMPSGIHGRSSKLFNWFFLSFASVWTIGSFAVTYLQYRTITSALRTGQYNVVEGPVTDFVPMPYTGHSGEHFSVAGVRFSYSDYIVTSGFHNTASHGGPIRAGLFVRVTYIGNLILRLEVAR